jgi:hypothetical protein
MFDDDLTRVWKLDQYVYMHSSCVVRSRPDTLYVGNFKDCRERYGIRVLRDARRGLVVMKLPKNPLYTTDMMVYKEEKIIKRLDGSVAFNAYSYDTELGEEPYSQEELNHLEPADL